jgi:Xaa-Pro aminopeptidase
VLTHCNSYADGYWTDITRTYCIGPLGERQRGMYEAVFAAREAALEAIRPGVKASAVDRAAREVMRAHGLGREFKHATGHGVGFAAINHNALPRLHPASPEILETGMVFNVEPAAYISGFGGLRQCDMVAVTPNGVELLTPFQSAVQELIG